MGRGSVSGKRGAKRRAPRAARSERRRWIVDSIAEESATIEEDGERIVRVPLWLLPEGVREGSVLTVTRGVEAEGVELRIELDAEGEAEALERSRRQVEGGTGDAGGDVVL